MDGSDTTTNAKRALPFWGRAAVVESIVDSAERPSGLIVPTSYDGDDGLKRGVIIALGPAVIPQPDPTDLLREGTVVFYRRGVKIGDVFIVEFSDIVAYESD